ncbi:hypothetical protein [Burkholderia cenocepacia]|uniref:hypothetical protein n=1 Tax=Burkholderia cenocepacia TaxID=95486 RepID=UPI002876CEDE|nr:hypothetical protein [Burkholderia cenocepacia]MDS0849097.1 hypothetical protein [Burkholderia cenocepacia]
MVEKTLINLAEVPNNLLSRLESRDVALWIRDLPEDGPDKDALLAFLGLPWRLVISELNAPAVFEALAAAASLGDPLTRKRGFVQIVDTDPSRIELPQRCLPIYRLNGRPERPAVSEFESRLRRMTMLEELRRSEVREILVVSGDATPVLPDMKDLWASGFRSYLTFASNAPNTERALSSWLEALDGVSAVNLLHLPAQRLIEDILARYSQAYPESRRVIRVRDRQGIFHKIDITEADEPERPILEWYSLIEERDVSPLMPEELAEEDFIGFFRNSRESWRPYAAGLPWIRDVNCKKLLDDCLKKLDVGGAEDNCIAYISSEPGAGGTTLANMLAWECAREGYPVLLAKPLPFIPDALPLVNFLTRVHRETETQIVRETTQNTAVEGAVSYDHKRDNTPRRYETPWVIVFDNLHWESRDGELARFRNEIAKSGRPVCLLMVTGTVLGLSFYKTSVFKRISDLNHALSQDDARRLGRHLNKFLRGYGKQRQESQWDQFHSHHTVRYLEGISAFWVTLSFWIQGQYDLSESIQNWMFRNFKENVQDSTIQKAILEIAALSSERTPLPEALLATSSSKWPVSLLLEDNRSNLSSLGLVRIAQNGEKYWALVHDILGRFLINALFYDFQMRHELGFDGAKDPEHLRFLLLRQISQKPVLGDRAYRAIGEDFATSIFKIDPDHGRASFALFWRDVLHALDDMPRTLRDTSRVFRHHTAVSRRRIAKLEENLYRVTIEDKLKLLTEAIDDINYALTFIDFASGSEPNVNLFNSLANAYFDLAKVESERGATPERILELRVLANDATRKAYEESPTSRFVIETYVKNLIEEAALDNPEKAVEHCVEALGILYSALSADEGVYRNSQLGSLADDALAILFRQAPSNVKDADPTRAVDLLIKVWKALAEESESAMGMALMDVPEENRQRALDLLNHPVGRGNMQVIRLSYDLTCLNYPHAYRRQLELVEQLQLTDYRMTPQLRLEYAILLYLNGRAVEGDKIFRSLRHVWRDGEHFVHVPARLRWLRVTDGETMQVVHALTGSEDGIRPAARVQEFNNLPVPFRPAEFGIRDLRPRERLTCNVSFGHNGPFLRPVTSHSTKSD